MKKLLLTLLITLSTTILAKTPESLFGVYINDNVLDYVTKEELKSKGKDYARGFYYVEIKNPPVSNKDYSDILWVRFDKNNKIATFNQKNIFVTLKIVRKWSMALEDNWRQNTTLNLKEILCPSMLLSNGLDIIG